MRRAAGGYPLSGPLPEQRGEVIKVLRIGLANVGSSARKDYRGRAGAAQPAAPTAVQRPPSVASIKSEPHERRERIRECGFISKKRLALRGASWANDFSSGTVIFVGLTEITGGLAILAPVVLGIAPRLAVTAGIVGLIVVTVGAAVVHASRREPGMIVLNVALLALTAVALWNRPGY
jgi:VIT1/CCC1 family predicted Fe2+/Mn2+ transporter